MDVTLNGGRLLTKYHIYAIIIYQRYNYLVLHLRKVVIRSECCGYGRPNRPALLCGLVGWTWLAGDASVVLCGDTWPADRHRPHLRESMAATASAQAVSVVLPGGYLPRGDDSQLAGSRAEASGGIALVQLGPLARVCPACHHHGGNRPDAQRAEKQDVPQARDLLTNQALPQRRSVRGLRLSGRDNAHSGAVWLILDVLLRPEARGGLGLGPRLALACPEREHARTEAASQDPIEGAQCPHR